MTAPEVWAVTDPDGGWEVYIPNASGGWRLVSSGGGTAVVDTLPDGAVRMGAATDPTTPEALRWAATVMEVCEERQGRWLSYSKTDMRRAADELEAETDEEREARELAKAIATSDDDLSGGYSDSHTAYLKVARSLIAAGWTRGGDRRG